MGRWSDLLNGPTSIRDWHRPLRRRHRRNYEIICRDRGINGNRMVISIIASAATSGRPWPLLFWRWSRRVNWFWLRVAMTLKKTRLICIIVYLLIDYKQFWRGATIQTIWWNDVRQWVHRRLNFICLMLVLVLIFFFLLLFYFSDVNSVLKLVSNVHSIFVIITNVDSIFMIVTNVDLLFLMLSNIVPLFLQISNVHNSLFILIAHVTPLLLFLLFIFVFG